MHYLGSSTYLNFILFLIAFSGPISATTCGPINLVTQSNSPFNRVPVTDQDGIGMCYAYAGAQLMNYHLVKNGREPSVHQLFLGVEFTRYTEANLENASNSQAMAHLIRRGNCPAARVREALSTLVRKANSREEDVYGFIIKVAERLFKLQRERTMAARAFRPVALTEQEVTKVLTDLNTEFAPYCQPGTRLTEIFPELRALAIMTPENVMHGILSPFCQTRERLSIPTPKYRPLRSSEDALSAISETLANGQSPVSVTYCSRVLYQSGYFGIRRGNNPPASDCGLHESLVVGRRPVGPSCEFLVRNSWGTGFGRHTANSKCLCKHRQTGAFVEDCTNATHNNGDYTVEACWIDSRAFAGNSVEMTWL